jgi:hypothetical protein
MINNLTCGAIAFNGSLHPTFQLVLASKKKETGLMQLISLELTKRLSSPVSSFEKIIIIYECKLKAKRYRPSHDPKKHRRNLDKVN